MTIKIIPEKYEITCDCCQTVVGTSKCLYKQQGKIIIKQHILDLLENPATDGTVEFDLCDNCLNKAIKTINQIFDEIRTGYSSEAFEACKRNGCDPQDLSVCHNCDGTGFVSI